MRSKGTCSFRLARINSRFFVAPFVHLAALGTERAGSVHRKRIYSHTFIDDEKILFRVHSFRFQALATAYGATFVSVALHLRPRELQSSSAVVPRSPRKMTPDNGRRGAKRPTLTSRCTLKFECVEKGE